MKFRCLVTLLLLLNFLFFSPRVTAVENGVILSGDENAVYLLDGSVNAFLYKPQIVFTSAHGTDQWAKGELIVKTSSGQTALVERLLIAKGYKDR